MPILDRLLVTLDSLPEDVAILSPKIVNPDNSTQVCGRPYQDWITDMKCRFGIPNKKNIFKSRVV